MNETLGFIGLGSMGLAIASNLQAAGYTLRVYNRSPEKADSLMQKGAFRASSPTEVLDGADIVFTMLSDDGALEEVVGGENGLAAALRPGKIHVSMSTVSPGLSKKMAEHHHQAGAHYLTATVFGKPDAAAAAKLWICVSGAAEAKKRVSPLLEFIGQGIYDFGEQPGAANVVKLAGNFLLGAAIEAMAEAFTLGEKNGIARTQMLDLFSNTLFACPVYKNYGKLIAEENYQPVGAPPALIRKDMRLVLETAQQSLVPMPFAHIIFDQLTATVAKGKNDIDWAGFAGEVSENAGLRKQ
jgi:3-hydroxyisobutyrate dehydrogenase-like beta-hydroxyacid dehydrogenase